MRTTLLPNSDEASVWSPVSCPYRWTRSTPTSGTSTPASAR